MSTEVKEIYNVLIARPDIKALFDLILSLPEEKHSEAVKIATDYINEVRQ